MKKQITLRSLRRKLVLALLLAFNLLLANAKLYGQLISDFGPMYDPMPIIVKADSHYNGPVIFQAYQYDISPIGTLPVYAIVLYRGGLPIDPSTPILVKAESPTSPLGVNIFTDEIGNYPQPYLPIPFITNVFPQSTTTDPFLNSMYNPPFTSEMAVSVFWGTQYVRQMNEGLYNWKGLDELGLKSIPSVLRKNITGIAYFDPLTGDLNYGFNNGNPAVSLDVIAHEMGHGMLYNSAYAWLGQTPEEEGLCDVMGLVAKNHYNKEIGQSLSWELSEESNGVFYSVANLKALPSLWPTTYKGDYYAYTGTSTQSEIAHRNSKIILSWFHKVSVGATGTIDDKGVPGEDYHVEALAADALVAMEKASLLLFETYTGIFSGPLVTDLTQVAELSTLKAAASYGYGSREHIAVHDAWFAVRLKPKKFNDSPTLPCPQGQSVMSGQSQYNGPVSFNGTKLTGIMDLTFLGELDLHYSVSTLNSCATATRPAIKTEYISSDGKIEDAEDADADNVYDLYNNPTRSKSAVSVHWAVQQTASYLSQTHNHIGLDGQGSIPINSYLAKEVKFPGFNPNDASFHYDYDGDAGFNPKVSMDMVGSEIGYGVAFLQLLKPDPLSEAASVCKSFGDIIGLRVKNKERVAQGKLPVWNMGEDLFNGLDHLRSFSDPQSKQQPIFYKGEFYDPLAADPALNAGILNFWFYILSEGKTGHLDNDLSQPLYSVSGIGADAAEQIMWKAVMQSPQAIIDFNDFAKVVEDLVATDYGANSAELSSVQDALHAVGLRLSPAKDLASIPIDLGTDINPWECKIRKEIKYAGLEKTWQIQISESDQFPGGGLSYTSKVLTEANDTEVDPADGKTYVTTTFNLQANKTYYWRVTTEEFDEANCQLSPAACADLAFQLSLGLDVRSFTTDDIRITQEPMEGTYPWGGTTFRFQTPTSKKDPQIPLDIKDYHIRIYKNGKELINEVVPPGPAVSVQSHTNKKLMLNADDDYEWDICATSQPDVFGNQVNEGVRSEKMKLHTGTPSTASIMLKDIYPFYDHALVIPFMEAENASNYKLTIYKDAARTQVLHSETIPGANINSKGYFTKEIDIATVFKNELREDEVSYYTEIIPRSPDLTNDKITTKNNGVMYGDGADFDMYWKTTKPVIITDPSTASIATIDAAGNVNFYFKPSQVSSFNATQYHIEIASPDFSSPANIIMENQDIGFNPVAINNTFIGYNSIIPLSQFQIPGKTQYQLRITATSNGIVGQTSNEVPFEIAEPAPTSHIITITWDCGPNTPITQQTGQYILTGQPAGVDVYVMGNYDGYASNTPFNKPIDQIDIWGDPNVTGWVLTGDLPAGDYNITMTTKGLSNCATKFNIDLDGTVLPQHPAANSQYHQSVSFNITIP